MTKIFKTRLCLLLLAGLGVFAASPAMAQDSGDKREDTKPKESAHGSYEWKPSWGGGVEAGVFFSSLQRWNANLLHDQAQIDTDTVWHFDAALEASFLENTRLSLFGGYTTPFGSNPSLGAWYIGLEPAFTVRRDRWEMAVGLGAAMGMMDLSVDPNLSAEANLVLLRPFLEVRRYLGTSAAVYLRGGFNQWLPYDVKTKGLTLGSDVQFDTREDELDEGGAFLALGLRFGSYPEHVKIVADTDGDGVYDDIDDCVNEPGPAENDGCPWPDTDGDGVLDKDDKCPDVPGPVENDGCPWPDTDEDGVPDKDDKCPDVPGPVENDGCPWPDTDGDGVPDKDDKCPDVPGPLENDGCPLDSDGDGIPDTEDECPYEAGPASNKGCPIKRVVVTMKAIRIDDKVFFDLNKATIQKQSFDLLDEVADVIKKNPRIKKIEIQGHTDHAGTEKHNLKLSQDRADSVRQYLVDKGVEEDRLTAVGYGFSKPLVEVPEGTRETKEAAAQNRRVEFVILEQEALRRVVRPDEVPADAAEVEEVKGATPGEDAPADDEADTPPADDAQPAAE